MLKFQCFLFVLKWSCAFIILFALLYLDAQQSLNYITSTFNKMSDSTKCFRAWYDTFWFFQYFQRRVAIFHKNVDVCLEFIMFVSNNTKQF